MSVQQLKPVPQGTERQIHQRLHLWAPSILPSSGGIQTYSYFVLRALNELYPTLGKTILTKHDDSSFSEFSLNETIRIHSTTHIPRRLQTAAFAAHGLVQAISAHPRLIFATHPNFTKVLPFLKRYINVPYVSALHGNDAWDIRSPALIRGLREANRLLSVSQFTKIKVIECTGVEESKVRVVPNTFDEQRFEIRKKPDYLLRRHGLNQTQPVILTVGRLSNLEQHKGQDEIISGLPIIRNQFPDARYLIAGHGDDRDRLERHAKSLGVEDMVTFTGFVPDEDMSSYYNLCDVYAMPSVLEGFGIAFLEALACGKPVIAGNRDASREALDDGAMGALVNPRDHREIAECIIRVLKKEYPNPRMYQPEELRRSTIELFGFNQFKANLKRELDEVLSETK